MLNCIKKWKQEVIGITLVTTVLDQKVTIGPQYIMIRLLPGAYISTLVLST